jgi:hypothetical protein
MTTGNPTPQPSWKVAGSAAAVMVALALIGVGLATADVGFAREYWMALVPIYGLLCVYTAWKRARPNERLVLRQVLHWAAIAAAVGLDFTIGGTGLETQVATGMNALLLLALGCFLAGVHLDWLFVPVGLLLAATVFLVAKADQYLWLLIIAAALPLGAWIVAKRIGGSSAASAPDPNAKTEGTQ